MTEEYTITEGITGSILIGIVVGLVGSILTSTSILSGIVVGVGTMTVCYMSLEASVRYK